MSSLKIMVYIMDACCLCFYMCTQCEVSIWNISCSFIQVVQERCGNDIPFMFISAYTSIMASTNDGKRRCLLCPFCPGQPESDGEDDWVTIKEKGASSINRASHKRGVDLTVTAGKFTRPVDLCLFIRNT